MILLLILKLSYISKKKKLFLTKQEIHHRKIFKNLEFMMDSNSNKYELPYR